MAEHATSSCCVQSILCGLPSGEGGEGRQMSLAVMMLSLLVWISQVRFPVMRNQIDLVQIQEPSSTLQRIFVDGEQKDCEAHLPRHSVSLSVSN